MLQTFFILMSISLFLTGCTHLVAFKENQPVDVRKDGPFHRYEQDGMPVDPGSMINALSENPETSDSLRSARVAYYAGVGSATAGGFLFGYYIAAKEPDTSSSDKRNGLTASAVLLAAAIGTSFYVDGRLSDATEKHNARYGKQGGLRPFFAWWPNGQTSLGLVTTF